jgi:hypothetical protein
MNQENKTLPPLPPWADLLPVSYQQFLPLVLVAPAAPTAKGDSKIVAINWYNAQCCEVHPPARPISKILDIQQLGNE